MDALIGHTGFVGGNLMAQHGFGLTYNSRNIADLRGQRIDTLVCSGVPATMWLANNDPDADRANNQRLFDHVAAADAARVVLISTIAVYADASQPVDETSAAYETALAYGRHRREFEVQLAERFDQVLILRLPALFGAGLKKNFLFDLMNPVPSFLKPDAFDALCSASDAAARDALRASYLWAEGPGMWQYTRGTEYEPQVTDAVEAAAMTARNFTHPDSRFQFYDLSTLWADIQVALGAGIDTLNLATAPIRTAEIVQDLMKRELTAKSAGIVDQDMRSIHAAQWGGSGGYLQDKATVMTKLRAFLRAAS